MSNPYPTLYTTSTSPQVILGSGTTGLGADNALVGFQKYNSHTHLYGSPTNFYTYRLSIGDSVFIYDEDNVALFSEEDPPVIEYISPTELRISSTSDKSLDNRLLIIKHPPDFEESTSIVGVSIELGSSLVTFSPNVPRYGSVSSSILEKILKRQVSCTYNLTDTTSNMVIPLAVFTDDGWLEKSCLLTIDATATVKLQVKQFDGSYSLAPTGYSTESLVLNSGETLDYYFVEQTINSENRIFSKILDKSLQSPFVLEALVEDITKGSAPSLIASTYFSRQLEHAIIP